MRALLEEFIKEDNIIKEILNPGNRVILVVGDVDTGKTTLIACIADLIARHRDVGIVDLDMGQSHVGLPSTIAWGNIKGRFNNWSGIKVEDFYFTGALSPVGSLLPAAVGAKLITDKALSTCDRVIIDTTGLIAEPSGRVLKQFKIDLLLPDIILALENSDEMGNILDGFKNHKFPKIFRISVPRQVASKGASARTQYRFERFKSYFTGARTIEVNAREVGIRYTGEPVLFNRAEMKNRLVSFRDVKNNDIEIGIIKDVNLRNKKFLVRSPIKEKVRFSTLMIGSAQVDL